MMMLEKIDIAQNSSMMIDHEPMVWVFYGIGLLQVVSNLKRSLLASIKMKAKMHVAPNEKQEANMVM